MIHLTKEGPDKNPDAERRHLYEDNIVVRRDFTGKILTPEEFQEFQKIVNERRPYCGKDFIPQTFIPDLSKVRY